MIVFTSQAKHSTTVLIMKQYTDISRKYQGTEASFFLIEGENDKALNRYVRGHLNSIEKHLAQRGVRYAAFNIIHKSLFGSHSIKNLILRQCPTLEKEELNNRVKAVKNELKKESKSRLFYINSVTPTADRSYCADILCEDDFSRDNDYQTTLYKFLDSVVRCDIARYNATNSGDIKFRLTTENIHEEEQLWNDSEYLGCDLLADNLLCERCDSLSPIRFDNRFNISLPLYPQISIKLEPLPKALYILFLQHPEGIVLKDIQDYESELKRIYSAVSGRKNPTVVNRIFKALTDPSNNPLHKNLSIIRKCFLSKLRFEIACNYIPAYGRTKAHNIPIDSTLVEIPEIG